MITFVDLFCGVGLGARGAVRGGGTPLLGLDAWNLATQNYQANFPEADIITNKIENVDPTLLTKKYRPDVLLTSPECTAHSIARGAKAGSEHSRETALGIAPWIRAMSPRWIIVENVNRMKKWNRHDELVQIIEHAGYNVSDLSLNSADFGSAQARQRMFLICDREGTEVNSERLLADAEKKAKSANSILNSRANYNSKPLYISGRAENTIQRAERAIATLGKGVPFLIVYYGSDYAGGWQRLDMPLRTVTTLDRFGLVTWKKQEPYLRMLQPDELLKAMGGGTEHLLTYGNRRDKVKLCGNGVCAEVMTAIFNWIGIQQRALKKAA